MKPEYYAAEMRRLHELAQEFAEQYPEQAGMLNLYELRDKDPYVERLLEGTAFLTAQIREQIDNDLPEISESLLNQLFPQLLKPYPSATIMEFTARAGQLQKTTIITRGTLFNNAQLSKEIKGCQFRLTEDVKLNPIYLQNLSVRPTGIGTTVFELTIHAHAGNYLKDLDLSELSFYLHAEPALAVNLYMAFTANREKVTISLPDYPAMKEILMEGENVISEGNFDINSSMLPISGRSFPGFSLLHDYFSFREKFMFFKVNGLEKLSFPPQCVKFSIMIESEITLPPEHKLNLDSIRLHCVPAINLYELGIEPIRLTHEQYEYPMITDVQHQESTMIYEVVSVKGSPEKSKKTRQYHDLYSFAHRGKNEAYFHISRREYYQKKQHLYLSVGGLNHFEKEVLSCEVLAYNSDYPRKYLREGMLTSANSQALTGIDFKNLLRPSAMLLPPERKDFQWQLISHLALHYQHIDNKENLQTLLFIYEWTGRIENRRRIESIDAVSTRVVEVIRQGALRRGIEFHLVLKEENFYSIADLYLFGTLLHHYFTLYAEINMFIQTRVTAKKSQEEWLWKSKLNDISRQ